MLSLIVAVPFALTAGKGRGGNPALLTVALMTQARVADLAPVFHATPEALLQHLQTRGYKATSTDDSVTAIAAASAVPATEVLYAMMPSRRVGEPKR